MRRYTPQEIAAVNDSTDLVELVRRSGVALTRQGKYWVGHCPNHNDANASFKINVALNHWRCHSACGNDFAGTGAISWLVDGTPKMTFLEAMEMLTNGSLPAECKQTNEYVKKDKAVPATIYPIPHDVQQSRPDRDKALGIPNRITVFKDANGQPNFYEYRFNLLNEDGSPKIKESTGKPDKEFKPLCYTEKGWKFMAPGSPRPLYGLDWLAARPNAHVAVFEGAKCADYAHERSTQVCVSWQGGVNSVGYADWSPLAGKRVTLCRDSDAPGWKCMEWLGNHLQKLGCRVYWAVNPEGWPKGGDVADSGWDTEDLGKYLREAVPFANRGDNPHVVAVVEPVAAAKPFPFDEKYGALQMAPDALPDRRPDPNDPFVHLGYGRSGDAGFVYWYYIRDQRMLLSLTPNAMGEKAFLQLAPFTWWQLNYNLKNGKMDVVALTDMLIRRGKELGMFDSSKRRGRGVWMDDGRVVIHCGDRLVVDGIESDLNIHSDYIYEQKPPIIGKISKPLKLADANKYLELCKMMSWEAPVMGHLLAGWVTIAPLCGILPWRPHFWIVGPSGSGKSTILRWLAHKMLGGFNVFATGGTTEAGIRAFLQEDALPVLVEEMEGNSHLARANVQKILELVRGMSTNDSGSILKGGAGGGTGSKTVLHSMFMFASIQSGVDGQADKRRTTMGVLKKDLSPDAVKRWHDVVEPAVENLITREYVAAFQSRTFAMAKVIIENSKVFTAAVAAHLGSQPLGDQLGPLLAGANSLRSDKVVTYEDALKIVQGHEWKMEREVRDSKDEAALLDVILNQKIRFQINGAATERTVSQLVSMAAHPSDANYIKASDIEQALEQNGLLVKSESLWIACQSEWLRSVLNSPGRAWSFGGIDQLLARVDGATRPTEAVVMASKKQTKVVRIPLASCGIVPPNGAQMEMFAKAVDDAMPF